MKRLLNLTIATLILVGPFSASAQTTGNQRVVANIPFGFHVGTKNLPAGKYTITVINPSSDRKILQIRSTDGRSVALSQTTSTIGNTSEDAKLVFHRYGDQYFFAQAQMAGETVSLATLKSSVQRAQRQNLAKSRRTTVVIVTE